MSSSEIKLNIKLKEFFPWVFPFVKEVKCERISGIQSRFLASLGMMMLLHETELWLGIRFLQILGEAINLNCQRLADMATAKKIWTWSFLCLSGLAWCPRWGIRKNWAHDAPGLGLRAQESSKTGFLLWALSAVPAYRFFSNLMIQSWLTYILCQ